MENAQLFEEFCRQDIVANQYRNKIRFFKKKLPLFTFDRTRAYQLAVKNESIAYGDATGIYNVCKDYSHGLYKTAEIVRIFPCANSAINKGRLVVGTVSLKYKQKLCDLQIGSKKIRYFSHTPPVNTLDVQDNIYFTGGVRGHEIWDVETQQVTRQKYSNHVSAVKVINSILAAGCLDGTITLWDWKRSNEKIATFDADCVDSLFINDDILVTGHLLDNKFEIRDLKKSVDPCLNIYAPKNKRIRRFVSVNKNVLVYTNVLGIGLNNLINGKPFTHIPAYFDSIAINNGKIFTTEKGKLVIRG